MKKQLIALSILAGAALPLSPIWGQTTTEIATCSNNPTPMLCCKDNNGNLVWASVCARGYTTTSGCDPQKTSSFMSPGESLKSQCKGTVTISAQHQ